MSTLPLQPTYRVLAAMNNERGSPIARQWLDGASGFASPVKVRKLLHDMRRAGLVEGVEGSAGSIFWWKITEAGRTFLTTFARLASQ